MSGKALPASAVNEKAVVVGKVHAWNGIAYTRYAGPDEGKRRGDLRSRSLRTFRCGEGIPQLGRFPTIRLIVPPMM
jgi:hypothetical protein